MFPLSVQGMMADGASGVPSTPARPAAPGSGNSPAEKRARVGDFVQAPTSNAHFTDQEIQQELNGLKADVATLKGAVGVLREKHNMFVGDVAGTLKHIEERFVYDEKRWDICEKELVDIKTMLGHHSQGFIDCETFVKAQEIAAAETMGMYDEALKQLTNNMNERASFIQDRMIPDTLAELQGKVARELENMKSAWLPKAFAEMHENVTATIKSGLTTNLEAHLKDLIDGRVTVAMGEVDRRIVTLGEVTTAQLNVMEQKAATGMANVEQKVAAGLAHFTLGRQEPPVRAPPGSLPHDHSQVDPQNLPGHLPHDPSQAAPHSCLVLGCVRPRNHDGIHVDGKGDLVTVHRSTTMTAPPDPLRDPWHESAARTLFASPPGVSGPQVFSMTPHMRGGPGAPGGDGGGGPGGHGHGGGGGGGHPHGSAGAGDHMGAPPGMGGAITMASKLFEEKTARETAFQYDGVSNGASWRSDLFDYFIAKCPDGQPWIEWAERMGATIITPEMIDAEKRGTPKLMTELDPYVLSHHMWAFLQHCVSGVARQTFKNTGRRDGLNVWRALVLEINSQTACRRHGLRDKVQMQPQAESNEHVKQAIANWESLYSDYLEAGGQPMEPEDRRSQLLRILPTALRRDVFRKLDDFKDLSQIKEWIRIQIELEREWQADDQARRARPRAGVHRMEAELTGAPEDLPSPEDMDALLSIGPTSSLADILAIQNRFKRFGNRGAPRRFGQGGAAPAGARGPPAVDAAPGRLPGAARPTTEKCINCGSASHSTRDCKEARKAKHERPCWWCGKTGHMAYKCPDKTVPAQAVAAEAPSALTGATWLGCIAPEDEWQAPAHKPRGRARGRAEPRRAAPAKLGDFISKSIFEELRGDVEDTDAESESAACTTSASKRRTRRRAKAKPSAVTTPAEEFDFTEAIEIAERERGDVACDDHARDADAEDPAPPAAPEGRERRTTGRGGRARKVTLCTQPCCGCDCGQDEQPITATPTVALETDSDSEDEPPHSLVSSDDEDPPGDHDVGAEDDASDSDPDHDDGLRGFLGDLQAALQAQESRGNIVGRFMRSAKSDESPDHALEAPDLDGDAEHPLEAAHRRRRQAQDEADKWQSKRSAQNTCVNTMEISYPEGTLLTADPTVQEYIEMEVILDSGAGAHVVSKSHIPGYSVAASALTRAGAAFVGADGGRIKNHGEAELHMLTCDKRGGLHAVHTKFQVADVTRALWSVGVICDAGLKVTFDKDTASVRDAKGVELCHFQRKNGLYVATVKLKNPLYVKPAKTPEQGFRRQGS